jgi:hypothetical protein
MPIEKARSGGFVSPAFERFLTSLQKLETEHGRKQGLVEFKAKDGDVRYCIRSSRQEIMRVMICCDPSQCA